MSTMIACIVTVWLAGVALVWSLCRAAGMADNALDDWRAEQGIKRTGDEWGGWS